MRSILMMPEAENPKATDELYLVQGAGADRDRRVEIGKALAGADNGSGEEAAIANIPLPEEESESGDLVPCARGTAGTRKGVWATITSLVKKAIPGISWGTPYDVDDLRVAAKFPFDLLFWRRQNPGPSDPYTPSATLRNMAEAFGVTNIVDIGDASVVWNLDPAAGDGFGEGGWKGNTMVLFRASIGNNLVNLTGAGPKGKSVIFVSVGWGTASTPDSIPGGMVSWPDGPVGGALVKDSVRTFYFDEAGRLAHETTLPRFTGGASATPVALSKLWSLIELRTGSVELPCTFPAPNPSFPNSLIALDQNVGNVGGAEGAGVRVGGNSGVEIASSDSAIAPAPRLRRVGKIYRDLQDRLWYNKGKNESGVEWGRMRLDAPVESEFSFYQKNVPEVAVGWWAFNMTRFGDSAFSFYTAATRMELLRSIVMVEPSTVVPSGTEIGIRLRMDFYTRNGNLGSSVSVGGVLLATGGEPGFLVGYFTWPENTPVAQGLHLRPRIERIVPLPGIGAANFSVTTTLTRTFQT